NLSPYSGTATATTSSAPGIITFVQINSATPPGSSVSTVTVPFTAAQTAGNMNVVVVGWNDVSHAVTSISDTKGNAYTAAVGPTTNPAGGGLTQTIYYATNIKAAAAGANTVTVVFNGVPYYPDVRVVEYSGADPAFPVEITATGTGSTATSSTSTV